MIETPRRSVTRFFIPMIDVLTLLFCIFLIMPMVKATGDADGGGPPIDQLDVDDRQELERLRRDRLNWIDGQNLEKERNQLADEIAGLRTEKLQALQSRLAIRVLEIGEQGRLFYYDPVREKDRRREITRENVDAFIAEQKELAGPGEVYFLFLYPRPAAGNPTFPLRGQREEYDRWFEGVAHGYDIPVRSR